MLRCTNLYLISRMKDETTFNKALRHQSQNPSKKKTKIHEIDSLRKVVDELIINGITLNQLDGFYFGYTIPRIGKEFDILKFTAGNSINIELKSQMIDFDDILEQLKKNYHYISYLEKEAHLYTVITDSMACYKFILPESLIAVDFSEIAATVAEISAEDTEYVADIFRVSRYLVSPINNPKKFINGKYFLTQEQELQKKKILNTINNSIFDCYIYLSGKAGTGKTLLLYDIAKTLSDNDETLIIHCGMLSESQRVISERINRIKIVSDDDITAYFPFERFKYILVDESHRISRKKFDLICASVENYCQTCIFSSDPEQTLSKDEKNNGIVASMKELSGNNNYILSSKIRANKTLHTFILCLQNLSRKPKSPTNYGNIDIGYANDISEARELINYYRNNNYKFINFAKSVFYQNDYSDIEDYDTYHVIGQEFDNVLIVMDSSFYYSDDGKLKATVNPQPDYIYTNLLYQAITRARDRLAIIVVDAPVLYKKIVSILNTERID